MKQIYLDYAATTPADPEVVQAMLLIFIKLLAILLPFIPMGRKLKMPSKKQGQKLPISSAPVMMK